MADRTPRSRRAARARRRRARRRRQLGAAGAALAVVVAVVVVVATSGDGDDATVAHLELADYSISGDLEVPAGPVHLSAVNVGREPHNIGIRGGPISNQVLPGGTIELDIGTLEPGTYELWCEVPGHAEQGMVAPLVVIAA